GAVLIGARIVTGTVGVVIAAAVVAAAGWLPLPTIAITPSATTVTPVPTDQQRVCAGPILRLGSDTGEGATTASSIGTPHVDYSASEGEPSASQLESTDSTTGVAPVRTTILTMSNPGEVIATVDVTIYTESGEVAAAGTDGIVVPPGGQRILSLAGFAPDAVSPVVRVQSRGSLVVANLQQSVVRTLEPGGVDVVGTVSGPARTAVIPGIVLADPEAIAAHSNAPGYGDLGSVLRVFVPGEKDAHAKLTITPEPVAGAAAAADAAKATN